MIIVHEAMDVQYGLLDSADIEEMVALLADVFSRFDPPALAIGASYEEVRELVKVFSRRAPDDALTIVARQKSTGKLIGAALTDDFADPLPEDFDRLAGRFEPISALLDGLDEQYRKTHMVAPGEILHLFMLGVDAECGGRGIAQALVRLTLDNGKRRGYRRAIAEATGNVSQHIFRNLGFAELFRTVYKEFDYKGRRIFNTITKHEAIILVEYSLDTH